MPKVVDHEQRKREIAQATWKIIREKGIEEVSVRKIAEVMNLSSGSIRHYFPTQNELLRYCIRSAGEAVHQRIMSRLDLSGSIEEKIEQMINEIFPMDEEGQKEMGLWFSIVAFTQKHPHLHDISLRIYHYMRLMKESYINLLIQENLFDEKLDKEVEIERLYALVDGLSLHWFFNQERLTKEKMKQVLHTHLLSICKQE